MSLSRKMGDCPFLCMLETQKAENQTSTGTGRTHTNPEKDEQASRNWLTCNVLQTRPEGFEPPTLGSEYSTRYYTQSLIMIELLRIEGPLVLANRDISHRFMTSGKPIPSPTRPRTVVALHSERHHDPGPPGDPLNRSRTMLADPTIGDRIFRKAGDGNRPEFIWGISVQGLPGIIANTEQGIPHEPNTRLLSRDSGSHRDAGPAMLSGR